MKKIPDIKLVKTFLTTKNNHKVKLAKKLGYKTTVAIDQWIRRGSLPARRKDEILAFIKKELAA